MHTQKIPDVWLLVLIVGLPQLSETVYTPALPDIARSLLTSDAMVEYTLTIYLFGFALGTLFWGKLSDLYGRKSALLCGLSIYILGCIGCFYSNTIYMIMISRLIQAFGGSSGSVLGQAICRDTFTGPDRGKIFSIIGSALAFSPALGPVIGGMLDQQFGWPSIFLFLIGAGLVVFVSSLMRLPETHVPSKISIPDIIGTIKKMACDQKILMFGFLVAACNGIGFSYFAEGSFYLIEKLHLSPTKYGLSFICLAAAGFIGSFISKKMHDSKIIVYQIIALGNHIICAGTMLFITGIASISIIALPIHYAITITITCMSLIMAGIGIMIPNLLSIALEDYKAMIGTASSLFGFYYYCLISTCTLIMGMLHNESLYTMPIYFCILAFSMVFFRNKLEQHPNLYKC